jgi:hypothetical protein
VSVTIVCAMAILTTGCLHRRAVPQIEGVTLNILPECLTKPIVIEHCDPTLDPPKCKGPTHVNYKSGCEQVQIPK